MKYLRAEFEDEIAGIISNKAKQCRMSFKQYCTKLIEDHAKKIKKSVG